MIRLQNLKVKNKIIAVLAVIFIMFFILFGVSMVSLLNIAGSANLLNEKVSGIVEQTEKIDDNFDILRSDTNNVLFAPASSDLAYEYAANARQKATLIDKQLDQLIADMKTVNLDQKIIDLTISAKDYFDNTYVPANEALLKVSPDASDIDDVLDEWAAESELATEMSNNFDKIMYECIDYIQKEVDGSSGLVVKLLIIFFLVLVIMTVVSIIGAIIVGNSLTKRIKNIVTNLNHLSIGNFDELEIIPGNDEIGQLSTDLNSIVSTIIHSIEDIKHLVDRKSEGYISEEIDLSTYEGSYLELMSSINDGFKVSEDDNIALMSVIEGFAKGDFDIEFPELPNEKQRVNVAVESLRKNLKEVNSTVQYVISQASVGNLELEINADSYEGDWYNLVNGLDDLLKCLIKPFDDIKSALQKFSEGDINISMSEDTSGEFKEISETFNYCINEIRKYILDIDRVLNDLSNENLSTEITINYLGGFNRIKISINKIINKFNTVFGQFLSAADDISLGASQIAHSSASLADGNSEQVASLQELNSALNVISEKTTNNAEDARKADEIARQSNEMAGNGNDLMKSMLSSMDDISQSSNEISNIIKVIQDIAFQTNLLALNAAVEAARAGQHGKGFAVVAEEVRNLASRSQTAAKDTTVLINNSLSKIVYGSNLAKETGEALEDIVNSVSEVTHLIENIALSSEEQSISITGVTKGLKNIEEVVQTTASSSEEGVSVSEQLSNQAVNLRNLIGSFELKK